MSNFNWQYMYYRTTYRCIIPASNFYLLPLSHIFCTLERWNCTCTS